MQRLTNRRRFAQGAIATGALASAGIRTAAAAETRPSVLHGPVFNLSVDQTPVNITGRNARATAVNGSVPAPTLLWREGETVTMNVTNRLSVPTSIHWHGITPPAAMDGVPGVSFAGIAPGTTFTYRFALGQSGTYWYHSHSGLQEQTGLYGALIVAPAKPDPFHYDREHVVLLSDWTDEDPERVLSNLKFDSDYYNHNQRTAGTFLADSAKNGLSATLRDRWTWGGMRMSPTDLADITGGLYTYLVNGQAPASNWTALFKPGERVRLRFINGATMTFFDVRIPGLRMTVVQADGNNVSPVVVDEIRIGVAETYDVIVEPGAGPAYTIFAQALDRTGYARATLSTRDGASAPVPPMDPRPIRTMVDMGMAPDMAGMAMPTPQTPAASGMAGMAMGPKMGVGVDNVAMEPINRLGDPGIGLGDAGRRVLNYRDLRSLVASKDRRPPSREIVLHLTGNMDRYMWGFDGKKFSEAPDPIRLALNERVRFVLINDTMMEHPIHLHGMFTELDNGQGAFCPLKHTVIVKGGERLSYILTADAPGNWAYHCHLLFHMDTGMLRVVSIA